MTYTQTDRHANKTFRPIERIGPEGQFFKKNFFLHLFNSMKYFFELLLCRAHYLVAKYQASAWRNSCRDLFIFTQVNYLEGHYNSQAVQSYCWNLGGRKCLVMQRFLVLLSSTNTLNLTCPLVKTCIST